MVWLILLNPKVELAYYVGEEYTLNRLVSKLKICGLRFMTKIGWAGILRHLGLL